MTPQQAFDAELKRRLRERAQTLLDGQQAVVAELQAAKADILQRLAGQPSDFEQWRLPQLLAQIELVLDGATARMANANDVALRTIWRQGEDMVDKSLAAGGLSIEHQLPLLDVTLLQAMRDFAQGRLEDVGVQALSSIKRQLGLVALGANTPFEAIKAVQTTLQDDSTRRATTIVRTELGRAYAVAQQQRMVQAAKAMEGTGQVLEKQWRRSGKIHSRWGHDAIDGERVGVLDYFTVPSLDGPVKMLHPHDPQAPAAEVINCGCLAIPRVKGWSVATPGAKPFTDLEIKLDGRKGLLDQMAKRVGLRS